MPAPNPMRLSLLSSGAFMLLGLLLPFLVPGSGIFALLVFTLGLVFATISWQNGQRYLKEIGAMQRGHYAARWRYQPGEWRNLGRMRLGLASHTPRILLLTGLGGLLLSRPDPDPVLDYVSGLLTVAGAVQYAAVLVQHLLWHTFDPDVIFGYTGIYLGGTYLAWERFGPSLRSIEYVSGSTPALALCVDHGGARETVELALPDKRRWDGRQLAAALWRGYVTGSSPEAGGEALPDMLLSDSNTRAEARLAELPEDGEVQPAGMCVSPDGRRLAAAVEAGDVWYVALDGQAQPLYDEVASLRFSPDSRRLAYVATLEDHRIPVVDGVEGDRFAEVIGPVYSPDSRRVAYGGRIGSAWGLYVDGARKVVVPGLLPWSLGFTPDSQGLVLVCEHHGLQRLLAGDHEGAQYDQIRKQSLRFSPDGLHVAYVADRQGRWRVVLDDYEELASGSVWSHPVFSRDGRQLAYAAGVSGRQFVVVNGVAGRSYHSVGDSIQFGADGRSLVYPARRDDRWFYVQDGEEGERFDEVGPLVTSLSGGRMAYKARIGARWAVVCDGRVTGMYDAVGAMCFSPGGQHMAFVAAIGGKTCVVADGEPGPLHDWFFHGVRPGFDGEDALVYLALAGRSVYLMRRQLG